MIDLDAIRARDAAGVYESATADMANVHFKIAAADRRTLLAYVDALRAERDALRELLLQSRDAVEHRVITLAASQNHAEAFDLLTRIDANLAERKP